MKKVGYSMIVLLIGFVSTAINNVCWLIALYALYSLQERVHLLWNMDTAINVLSALFFITLHIVFYVLLYKKIFKEELTVKMYGILCAVPYITLIALAIYWFATFPLL